VQVNWCKLTRLAILHVSFYITANFPPMSRSVLFSCAYRLIFVHPLRAMITAVYITIKKKKWNKYGTIAHNFWISLSVQKPNLVQFIKCFVTKRNIWTFNKYRTMTHKFRISLSIQKPYMIQFMKCLVAKRKIWTFFYWLFIFQVRLISCD